VAKVSSTETLTPILKTSPGAASESDDAAEPVIDAPEELS
jgi:hypothetical protein